MISFFLDCTVGPTDLHHKSVSEASWKNILEYLGICTSADIADRCKILNMLHHLGSEENILKNHCSLKQSL